MIRVAYVCADPGVPVFGHKGCSVHVQEVIRALRGLGAEVRLFATRIGGVAPPGLETLDVHELPRPRGDPAERERASLEANTALDTALEAAGPFDLVYERHALWSFAAMAFARRHGTPGVLEVNAPLIEEQRRYRTLALEREADQAEADAFAAASAFVAVSADVASYLGSHAAVAAPVHIVPNGVDTDRFRPDVPPAAPATNGVCTIGFVGSLKPWHGVQTLIDAVADIRHVQDVRDVREVRLLIVGDGPMRGDLETRATRRGLRDVCRFTGAVSPHDVPAWLTSMDVAVAPYPDLDGFYFSPLKIFEAMAAGRAIVASRQGQVGDLIEPEATGLLYEPGAAPELAATLHRVAGDADLRRRLGAAARRRAVESHTWEAVGRRILALAGAPQTA